MKLQGIKVLDLSRFLPGPYVTMMMADHGAEVIKIESLDAGDPTRNLGPRKGGQTPYFRNTNRGKFSVALDLKSRDGCEAFLKLAETADVVLESFRPGVVKRLGIDYETVSQRAPGIVYCSISAFGQSGTLRDQPTHDLGIEAIAGVLSLGVGMDGAPAMPGIPVADASAAMTALAGILMALVRRQTTGEGDYIDAAMHDSLISWTPHISGEALVNQRAPVPHDERLYGGAAFYQIYRTSDGKHVTLSGAEMSFVRKLLTSLGRPDLIACCEQGWGAAQQPVKEFLAATFAQKTRDQWVAWMADKDVCFAPVLDLKEAYDHPHVRQRGMIFRASDGMETIGTPLKFLLEPGNCDRRAPELGEHNALIFGASEAGSGAG